MHVIMLIRRGHNNDIFPTLSMQFGKGQESKKTPHSLPVIFLQIPKKPTNVV